MVNVVAWFAFGLALADAFVLVLLAAAAVVAYRKAMPLLATFGMMGGMLGAAAGTGGIDESADSSPAAIASLAPLEHRESCSIHRGYHQCDCR